MEMGGRAAGFRPAVGGGVGRLSPGSDWETDCPDFGRTALRSPMSAPTSGAILGITHYFSDGYIEKMWRNLHFVAEAAIILSNTWQ